MYEKLLKKYLKIARIVNYIDRECKKAEQYNQIIQEYCDKNNTIILEAYAKYGDKLVTKDDFAKYKYNKKMINNYLVELLKIQRNVERLSVIILKYKYRIRLLAYITRTIGWLRLWI